MTKRYEVVANKNSDYNILIVATNDSAKVSAASNWARANGFTDIRVYDAQNLEMPDFAGTLNTGKRKRNGMIHLNGANKLTDRNFQEIKSKNFRFSEQDENINGQITVEVEKLNSNDYFYWTLTNNGWQMTFASNNVSRHEQSEMLSLCEKWQQTKTFKRDYQRNGVIRLNDMRRNPNNTEQEVITFIKKEIKKKFGKTFEQLKPQMIADAKQWQQTYNENDGWLRVPEHGFTVFYNVNPNYKQGAKNGGGIGFFATLDGVGMARTIRMESADKYKNGVIRLNSVRRNGIAQAGQFYAVETYNDFDIMFRKLPHNNQTIPVQEFNAIARAKNYNIQRHAEPNMFNIRWYYAKENGDVIELMDEHGLNQRMKDAARMKR